MKREHYVKAAGLEEVRAAGCVAAQVEGHTLALFAYGEKIYAVDNRCPHMGFPLDRGTVRDGILTCHWHHARFDLASGGTFDQFADDVRTFPVAIREGEVWVDVAPHGDPRGHHKERLQVGLERDISLVLAKGVITLLDHGGDAVEPFRIGLEFGTRYREAGWGQGLTIHTCMMNLLPHLDEEDRPRALYHGLSAVARETFGRAPRFVVRPLPDQAAALATLKGWFRRFIEVRDSEGAERCIVSAIRAGAGPAEMADMLFAAVTDHRYIQIGHVADFTNKAFEALDVAGWEFAEPVLTSLVNGYADASRMEESNAWRNPIDLIGILEEAFEAISGAMAEGLALGQVWNGRSRLVEVVLGDNPQAIADGLLDAMRGGANVVQLASAVSYAAALRIARFHTSNELGLYPDLTGREILDYIAILKGIADRPTRQQQVNELLDTVGLTDAANRRIKTYSGGMKRRLGIAQSLLGHPRLIIVDEPTVGLDPEERVKLRNLLADTAARCTVILSTHIVEDISQSCNDLAVINKGQVTFRGSPRDLISQARGHVWTIVTDGQRPGQGPHDLTIVATMPIQDGTQYRVLGQPTTYPTARPTEPTLEDGYIWLMKQTNPT